MTLPNQRGSFSYLPALFISNNTWTGMATVNDINWSIGGRDFHLVTVQSHWRLESKESSHSAQLNLVM